MPQRLQGESTALKVFFFFLIQSKDIIRYDRASMLRIDRFRKYFKVLS